MKKFNLPSFSKFSLGLALCLGLSAAMPAHVSAETRDLSQQDVEQLFEALLMKEVAIVNTDEIELEDQQRKDIAEEIALNFTRSATIQLKEVIITEMNDTLPVYRAKMDRAGYEMMLRQEADIKNMRNKFEIKNLELMGQTAEAGVTLHYNYEIDQTGYEHQIKMTADVASKANCTAHMRLDYDDIVRFSYVSCDSDTLVSNIDLDVPDYMKEEMGSVQISFGPDVIFRR